MSKHNQKTDETHAQQELSRRRITCTAIGAALGVDPLQVSKALHPERFQTMRYATVIRVRAKAVAFLRAAGWTGDASELWREYDDPIESQKVAA